MNTAFITSFAPFSVNTRSSLHIQSAISFQPSPCARPVLVNKTVLLSKPVSTGSSSSFLTRFQPRPISHLASTVGGTTTQSPITCSASSSTSSSDAPKPSLWEQFKVPVYILFWYILNIGYNIYNKKALNVLPLPWFVSWVQLAVGALWVLTVWLLKIRKQPVIPKKTIKAMIPVAVAHVAGHVSTVLSLGAVAVSFTHVIKSMEPFFNVLGSALILKSVFPIPVYLSLIPVVAGVVLASVSELSFTWFGFFTAMLSNVAFTGRNIFSKISMGADATQGTQNFNAVNIFGILSIISTLLLAPVAGIFEAAKFASVWKASVATASAATIWKYLVLSGMYFQLYQEVAFLALDAVHPVTHSVANTVKRVVIIATSIIVFKNPVTAANMGGSAIAILGVLLYSLTKAHYDRKAKQQKSQ